MRTASGVATTQSGQLHDHASQNLLCRKFLLPRVCADSASCCAQHEGSHNVSADGWFATGDVANIDRYGHVQLADRVKDVIKSGGEWISSIDLENVAVAHPQARAACCQLEHLVHTVHRGWPVV